MTSTDLLTSYAAGERNFWNANLSNAYLSGAYLYHAPTQEQRERYEALRAKAKELALLIADNG